MCLVARRLADVYTQLSIGRAAPDGSFGRLAVLLEEDAAYHGSERFGAETNDVVRLLGRPARAA